MAQSLTMRVMELLDADRFAAALGVRLVGAEPEWVVVEMDVAPHHRDSSGAVSSGALFSLADCAMSLISNAEGTAVAVATHFTRSPRTVETASVRAVARPELPVGDVTSWEVVLEAGEGVVASFTGTTLRLD